ncbi:SEC10/PgrA surface exclusion domain-containing protein [Streptococcus suis]
MTKKIAKTAGFAAATTLAVLGQQAVEASEVVVPAEPVADQVLTTEATDATTTIDSTSSETASPVTEEEVIAAEDVYKAAEAEQVAQEEVVATATAEMDSTQAQLDQIDSEIAAIDSAQTIIENAPQIIEQTESKIASEEATIAPAETAIATAESLVATEATDLATAKAGEVAANQVVADAETALADVKADLAEVGLESAQTAVDNLKTTEAKQIQQVSSLENAVKVNETAVTNAEKALTSAQTTAKQDLDKEISQVNAELSAKKTELANTPATTTTTTNTVKSVVGSNKITLPSSYINTAYPALKQIENAGYTGSTAFISVANQNKSKIVVASQQGTYGIQWGGSGVNTYQSIAADKTRTIDPANLTKEVQNEIAQFTAEILNGVRTQLGLASVAVTSSAQDFAKRVASAYNSKGLSTLIHDFTDIGSAATASGLKTSDNRGYESLGDFGHATTVDQLKGLFYNSLVYMLFNDEGSNFGHTISLLQNSGNDTYYLGATSRVASSQFRSTKATQTQIYMIPSSNIVSSNFSQTPITGTTSTTVDNTNAINKLKAEIKTLETTLSNLKSTNLESASIVVAANQTLRTAKNRLQTTKDNLATAKATLEQTQYQLTVAQKNLASLTAQNQQLLTKQGQAQTALAKALVAQKAEVAKVAQAQEDYDKAVEAETAAKDKLVKIHARIAGLKEKITETEKLVANATTLIADKERLETQKSILAGLLLKQKADLVEQYDILKDKTALTVEAKEEYLRLLNLYRLATGNNVFQLPDGTIVAVPAVAPTADALPEGELPILTTLVSPTNLVNTPTEGSNIPQGSGAAAAGGAGAAGANGSAGTVNLTSLSAGVAPAQGTSQSNSAKSESEKTLPKTSSVNSDIMAVVGMMSMGLTFGLAKKKRDEI